MIVTFLHLPLNAHSTGTVLIQHLAFPPDEVVFMSDVLYLVDHA